MSLKSQPVRNLYLAYALLLASNVGGAFTVLPIFLQLLISSCCCVYIGCLSSTRLAKNEKGTILNYSKLLTEDEQVISMSDAKEFPLYASCFLFGFYLLYKFVSKDIFTSLVSGYFSITIVFSLSSMFFGLIPFSQSQRRVFYTIKFPKWLQNILEADKFEFSTGRIICILISTVPVGIYLATRHWILNNIFAVLFTIMGLKSLSLSSTKTGLFLLWALFFYDIFWVYGTDVMVTVAKNLDIPIKILFPFINGEGDFKTSMVGLGDLVIPGIFVSLCLKYDFDQSFAKNKQIKSFSQIKLNYFNLAFVGYFYGIVETFLAMFIFEHPQPALLFLVPMCTIPVLVRALLTGEINQFVNYDTQLIAAQQNKEGTGQGKTDKKEVKNE